MKLGIPKDKVKKEAKKIKEFLILIKKKLNRQQISRSYNFRKLLALVFDPDEKELLSQTTIVFLYKNCWNMSELFFQLYIF